MRWVGQVWNRRQMQVGRELGLHESLRHLQDIWWRCPGHKTLGRSSEPLGLEPLPSYPRAQNPFLFSEWP